MTTAIIVNYENRIDFSNFAAELRALGATFYVTPEGSNRIIEFKTLTSKASQFIESLANQETSEEIQETVVESPSTEPETDSVVEESVTYFTASELNKNYTKKQLEDLAKSLEIALSPSCKKKAGLVKFLAGKIQK
ncbi:MAG: hypothetical protein AAGF26_01630 [Cyanobacteria bacterium P01_G01_bin.49]